VAIEAVCKTLAQTLEHHHACFAAALSGLDTQRDRTHYAYLLLSRLLVLYDLQIAGFLGGGDRWYLHNQLERSQQQQPDSFFQTGLLPLCHQGVGLPEGERPRPLQSQLGQVPYLGGSLFQIHPLEQHYPDSHLPDEPLEGFLGWLAEQTWQRSLDRSETANILTRTTLAGAWEWLMTQHTGKATLSSPQTLTQLRDRTVDAYLLKRLPSWPFPSVAALLEALEDDICHALITDVLPSLTVLDPACGSGRFLLMVLTRLQHVYHACWHHAQRSSSAPLQAWAAATSPWTWTRQLLTQTLYGLDQCPLAVEITRCQLWLALLSTATTLQDLTPLPDLAFNITTGNALVGFIRVDAESFDQIVPKRSPPRETVLQGNLLQPLAAASYRDTLTERHIRVEHYRAQTRAMAESSSIPEYVQTEFLRDRIDTVNQTAQQKLNRLLLETWSRKLGIQIREPQISGRSQRRLLTLEDIEALQPFHWGFFFHEVLEQRGGFEVILTQPPTGTLSPNSRDFYQHQADLFQQYGIEQDAFRRSRRALLQRFPTLAKRWATYAGRFSCLRAYVRRSDDYQLPATTRALPLPLLFAQRCQALLRPGGIPPVIHPPYGRG